jgi:hypothetical protein
MLIHYYNIWDVSKWPLLFVPQLLKLEAVITYPLDHLFDSFLDQCFRQTFLSILVYSFHRFLQSFRNWDMFKCPTNTRNLLTVKHTRDSTFYLPTKLNTRYIDSSTKAVCLHASNVQVPYEYTEPANSKAH